MRFSVKKHWSRSISISIVSFLLVVAVVVSYLTSARIEGKAASVHEAIDFPSYQWSAESSAAYSNDDLFLVTLFGERRIAYPIQVMLSYPVVNDEIDGIPFVATYCVRCQSGIVFDRRISDGGVLMFDTTGLVHNDAMVLYDRETGSYWAHASGASIQGPLAGEKLAVRSSTMMTYQQLNDRYPNAWILSLDSLTLNR